MLRRSAGVSLVLAMVALSAAESSTATPAPVPGSTAGGSKVTVLALPGAPPDGVSLDYLAIDRARHRVWVPAGGTGSTDVIDTTTRELRRVERFPTAEVERRGRKRLVGPSSATVGDGVVYVGNRADSTVCAVDATTLERGACVTVPSMPDGLAFIARTKEAGSPPPAISRSSSSMSPPPRRRSWPEASSWMAIRKGSRSTTSAGSSTRTSRTRTGRCE